MTDKDQRRSVSLFQYSLLAFVLFALPLSLSLVMAIHALDRLGTDTAWAVYETLDLLDTGRVQRPRIMDAGRASLADKLFRDDGATDTSSEPGPASLGPGPLDSLERAEASSPYSFRSMRHEPYALPHSTIGLDLLDSPPELLNRDAAKTGEARQRLEDQLGMLRLGADKVHSLMFWQAAGLTPLLIVIVIFGCVLTRKGFDRLRQALTRETTASLLEPLGDKHAGSLARVRQRIHLLRLHLLSEHAEWTKRMAHHAHDLKGPLMPIKEGINILKDGLTGTLNAQQHELVAAIDQSSDRLAASIQRLVQESGQQHRAELQRRTQAVSLDGLVRAAATDQGLSLQRKALRLQLSLDPLRVHGNAQELRSLVDNLLINAIQHSPEGGTIAVSISARGQRQALLEVRDQGPGVALADREQVFQPYCRGSTVSMEHRAGSGLGLAIAAECVRLHGGSIEIANSLRGACFRVSLPMRPRRGRAVVRKTLPQHPLKPAIVGT
jgi:two-component system sensor histidine kinase GlrK